MKKEANIIILVSVFLILSVSFVSANFFQDTFNKITGKALASEECVEDWMCVRWSNCVNNQATRTCRFRYDCPNKDNKPATVLNNCIPTLCKDSDGGRDYYVKGSASKYYGVTKSSKGEFTNFTDDCYYDPATRIRYVEETICDENGDPKFAEKVACPDECFDGACINTSSLGKPRTCIEDWHCSSHYPCENGTQRADCVDANNCGTTQHKPAPTFKCDVNTCIGPTRDQEDPFTRGFVDTDWKLNFTDYCTDSYGGAVVEYFCYSIYGSSIDRHWAYDIITCPDGCKNGACIRSNKSNSCVPNWVCGDWGWSCTLEGFISRRCQDTNNCANISTKPNENKPCPNYPLTPTLPSNSSNSTAGNNPIPNVPAQNNPTNPQSNILNNISTNDSSSVAETQTSSGAGGRIDTPRRVGQGYQTIGTDEIIASVTPAMGISNTPGTSSRVEQATIFSVNPTESQIIGSEGEVVATTSSSMAITSFGGRAYVTKGDGTPREIRVDPTTAIKAVKQSIKTEKLGSVTISEYQDKIVYNINVEKQIKILYFIKSKMNVEAQVDVEEGSILRVNKPWWSFLAKEI